MKHNDLNEKRWTERDKIERMWITVGFGKAILNFSTEDGYCYVCNLKELDIRMARLNTTREKKWHGST